MTTLESNNRRGLLLLAIGTVGMSVIPIMAQVVMRVVPPTHFTGLWMAFSAVWASLFAAFQSRRVPAHRIKGMVAPLLLISVLATCWVYLYFFGVARLDAAIATFLINSRIIWGVILGIVFFGERIGPYRLLSAFLAIGGVLLVFLGDIARGDPIGMLAMVVAALFFVLVSAAVKRHVPREFVAFALFARFFFPAVVLTAVAFSIDPDVSFLTPRAIAMLAVGSFFGPFLSFLLIFTAIPLVQLGLQSIFQSLGIVFTALVSFLVFGTKPTLLQYVGGATILFGVLLAGTTPSRRGNGNRTPSVARVPFSKDEP